MKLLNIGDDLILVILIFPQLFSTDVLIAKKSMFRNQDRIIAENGIIGEIKLGLVFELKNSVGCSTIIDKESDFTRYFGNNIFLLFICINVNFL